MAKKISAIGGLALVMLVYLIWKNPSATADLINAFFRALGGFFSDLWDRIVSFVDGLG